MARVAGVEPAAPSFGGSCSIQLSYTRATAGVPNMTPTVRLRIEGAPSRIGLPRRRLTVAVNIDSECQPPPRASPLAPFLLQPAFSEMARPAHAAVHAGRSRRTSGYRRNPISAAIP